MTQFSNERKRSAIQPFFSLQAKKKQKYDKSRSDQVDSSFSIREQQQQQEKISPVS